MIYDNDLKLIIENIKDIFYEEINIEYIEDSKDPPFPQIDEGLFFDRLENYLKNFFNVKEENKFPLIVSEIEWEDIFSHPSFPYSKVPQYIINRGKNWNLPSIDDFICMSNVLKKNFTNDLYWSSTPYDQDSYWAFSFKTNRKIITNKNLYCHVILKRNVD
jgi:hypothetical protein